MVATGWLLLGLLAGPVGDVDRTARVPLKAGGEVDLAEVVEAIARLSRVDVARPSASLNLPTSGLAAPLTRTLLAETLGPDATLDFRADQLVVTLDPRVFEPEHRAAWETRLRGLAGRTEKEVSRRSGYGMHARPSYRPDDPSRPTVCLIHGLNSTSRVFKHLFEPIEAAGYGVVVYDFPYNRDLDETSAAFRRDWLDFRKKTGDRRSWSVVAHSMGSLLARSYVEDDATYAGDVDTLILIAPPNQGSTLARGQTMLQTVQSLQAVNGSRRAEPLAMLGDGLGAAAEDMTPGSAYLKSLNARPRRDKVRYRILAGDDAYLSADARRQVEGRLKGAGVLGGIGRLVTAGASASLDEVTDGLGDGCVALASTRLDGVDAPTVLHANHLELIRAPLLYPDPGPVASMPSILRWLAEGR